MCAHTRYDVISSIKFVIELSHHVAETLKLRAECVRCRLEATWNDVDTAQTCVNRPGHPDGRSSHPATRVHAPG